MQITRNDYPLAPDKIEITEEMLHHSNILIADFNNIPIVNVKKLAYNFLHKIVWASLLKPATLFKASIKAKKMHRV